MSVATVSVLLAAASVVAVSVFYSFQIWHQTRLRRADLLLRLYATWDTLEFQKAFHQLYWAELYDYDSFLERFDGRREVGSYVLAFYDQIGVLLRRRLIDYDLVDDLLGNSAIQLWEKVWPVVREARIRSHDNRLYEHFEHLYDEMARRAVVVGSASNRKLGQKPSRPQAAM
jgi:hypothetical protein